VPSYSANIDNIFFSFDRNTSKIFTKTTTMYPKLALIPNYSSTSMSGYTCVGEIVVNNDNNLSYKVELYDDN